MADPTDPKKSLKELISEFDTQKSINQEVQRRLQLITELAAKNEELTDNIDDQKAKYDQINERINLVKKSKSELIDAEQILKGFEEQKEDYLKKQFRINQDTYLLLLEEIDKKEKSAEKNEEELDRLEKKKEQLLGILKSQGQELEKLEKQKELKEKILSLGKDILNNALKYGEELEKHIIEISRLNGGYDKYTSSLREANNLMYAASVGTGLRIEELNKAFQGLSANFIGLTTQSVESITAMGKAVADLGKLGVDAATASKSFDSLVAAMGKTPQQAVKIQDSFTQMAARNRLALGSVTQAFAENSSRFVGYGEQMTKVLDGLAEQSLKTGVAISKLVGIAQQFDTFEGAARAVGNLNALLGGDYLNSIELLTASDDERIKLLKEGVAASGMQWESMNRFQKMAVANAAGINDLNEASKIFGQTSLQNTRQQAEGAEVQKTLAQQAQSMTLAMDKLKSSLNGLILILEPIVTIFMKLVGILSEAVQWLNGAIGPIFTSLLMGAIFIVGKFGLSILSLGTVFKTFGSWLSGGALRMKEWIAQKLLMDKVASNPINIQRTTMGPVSAATSAVSGPSGATSGFLSNAGNMLKAAGSILLFAAALYVLAKALQEFSSDKINAKAIIPAIASIAALLVIFKTIDKATGQIAKGALGVGIMALALIALGVGLAMFFKVDWKLIAGIGAIILGLGLAIAGFGFAVSGPQALLIAAGIAVIIGIAVALVILGNSLEKISTSFKTLSELKNIGELSSNLIKFLDDLSDTSVSPIQNLAEAIGLLAENLQKLASVSANMAISVTGNAKTVLTEQVSATATAVTKTSEAISSAVATQPLIPAAQTTTFVPLIVQIDKKNILNILTNDIQSISRGEALNVVEAVGIAQSSSGIQDRIAAMFNK